MIFLEFHSISLLLLRFLRIPWISLEFPCFSQISLKCFNFFLFLEKFLRFHPKKEISLKVEALRPFNRCWFPMGPWVWENLDNGSSVKVPTSLRSLNLLIKILFAMIIVSLGSTTIMTSCAYLLWKCVWYSTSSYHYAPYVFLFLRLV